MLILKNKGVLKSIWKKEQDAKRPVWKKAKKKKKSRSIREGLNVLGFLAR